MSLDGIIKKLPEAAGLIDAIQHVMRLSIKLLGAGLKSKTIDAIVMMQSIKTVNLGRVM